MRKGLLGTLLLAFFPVAIFLLEMVGVQHMSDFSTDIFRLSSQQVRETLSDDSSSCKKLRDCTLQPGDILIRRYITERTWLVDALVHPFFTHSAFYVGNDKIVEAVGKERDPSDEIRIATLSQSDWYNSDLKNWVIIRPTTLGTNIVALRGSFSTIAEDNEYTFGLPEQGKKRFTCADLILSQFARYGVVDSSDAPSIVSPDYLFWKTTRNSTIFTVIGYHLAY
jgi:hypothetical protein